MIDFLYLSIQLHENPAFTRPYLLEAEFLARFPIYSETSE